MGMGGGVGFVGRAFGGMAARSGATLTAESVASVAARAEAVSGTIGGDIADRSLGNYMPQMQGHTLKGTQITGGHISTTATGPDGKTSNVEMYSAAQFEKPSVPHSVVTAADGSSWYQRAAALFTMRRNLQAVLLSQRRLPQLSRAPRKVQRFVPLETA